MFPWLNVYLSGKQIVENWYRKMKFIVTFVSILDSSVTKLTCGEEWRDDIISSTDSNF